MAYKEGETFQTYCDNPYDKHKYKLVLKNGKSIVYDDYDLAKYFWYQYRKQAKTLLVIDCASGKGF